MTQIRAVLHAHSTWSYDGRWSLHRIARLYGRLGIDVVMMSEHDTGFDPARFPEYRAACAEASTARCTLVPGIEYSSPENDIHILTWGLTDFLAEHRPVTETLQAVKAQDGVAIFAHPVRRRAWQAFDPAWVPYLSGIELWNRKSDGITWGPEAWALLQSTGLPATVGQDFHRLKQLYPLTMRFPDLSHSETLEADLVAALKAGRGVPCAFGRPVLRDGKGPAVQPHQSLERGRKALVRLKGRLKP